MIELPKSAIGIAAGISGLLFLGYCFYFDQRRHADPNFKKKLREKRRQKRLSRLAGSRIPDLRDQEAVQKFFLSEVQLGEELLSQGEVDGAVEHLGSAIAVCGHPQQLLQILQQTLPPQVFHILLQRLPMIGQSFHARHEASFGAPVASVQPAGGLGGAGPANPFGGPGLSMGGTSGGPSFLSMEDELE
jgi:import receptor subunit TOM20